MKDTGEDSSGPLPAAEQSTTPHATNHAAHPNTLGGALSGSCSSSYSHLRASEWAAQHSDAILTSPGISNILHLHNPHIHTPACVFFRRHLIFFFLKASFKIDLNQGRLDSISDVIDETGI